MRPLGGARLGIAIATQAARVVIESPYAGNVARNVEYACEAMRDSIARGECPFASHLLYTHPGILDDMIPAERALGIELGQVWGEHAELVAVYEDLGVSPGMAGSIELWRRIGKRIQWRKIR